MSYVNFSGFTYLFILCLAGAVYSPFPLSLSRYPLTSEILVGDAPTCYKLSATASAQLGGVSSAHHWVKVTITHWSDIRTRRTGRRGVGPRDILNDSIISGSAVSGSTHESASSPQL